MGTGSSNNGNGKRSVDYFFKILTSILTAALAALFVWVWNANTELKLLRVSVDELVTNKTADTKQNEMLSKHWKIVSFHRDKINELRHDAGKGPVSWPDLD